MDRMTTFILGVMLGETWLFFLLVICGVCHL